MNDEEKTDGDYTAELNLHLCWFGENFRKFNRTPSIAGSIVACQPPPSLAGMVPARYFRSQVSINNNPLTRRCQQPLGSQVAESETPRFNRYLKEDILEFSLRRNDEPRDQGQASISGKDQSDNDFFIK